MFDKKTHRVKDRIVSISQPYIWPIVRGKVKTPVEFGIKFDLSLDEYGMGLGLIKTKLEDTSYGAVDLSIFVTNLFRILDREVRLFFAFFKVRDIGAEIHLCYFMAG